jgi:hypothetical protein
MKHRGMVTLTLALLVFASGAHAVGVTVGGFGGMNIPIVQDDAGSGPLFGFKVKLASAMPFVAEPYFLMITEGDKRHSDEGIDFTQEGGSVQAFGVDLAFGSYREDPGANLYFMAGLGAYSLNSDSTSVWDWLPRLPPCWISILAAGCTPSPLKRVDQERAPE